MTALCHNHLHLLLSPSNDKIPVAFLSPLGGRIVWLLDFILHSLDFFSSSSSSFTSHRRRCGSVRAYANAQTPSTQKRDRMEYLHYHEQLIKEPNISKQAPPFAYVHIEEWLHQRSAPPILCIVTLALSPFLNAMWFKVFRLQKTFFSSYLVVA